WRHRLSDWFIVIIFPFRNARYSRFIWYRRCFYERVSKRRQLAGGRQEHPLDNGSRCCVLLGSNGKISPVSTACLATRCHGGTYFGIILDSRRDHGSCGRVPFV